MRHLLFYLLVTCSQIFVCIHGMLQEAAQAAAQGQQAQQSSPNNREISFNSGLVPLPTEYNRRSPLPFPLYQSNQIPVAQPWYNQIPIGGVIPIGGPIPIGGTVPYGTVVVNSLPSVTGTTGQQIGFNSGLQEGFSGSQQGVVNQQSFGLNSFNVQEQGSKVDLQSSVGIPYSRTDASGRPIYTISDLCRLLAQGILPGNVAVQPYGPYTGLEKVIQDAINANGDGSGSDLGFLGQGTPIDANGQGDPYNRPDVAFGPNMAPLSPREPYGLFVPNGLQGPIGPLIPVPLIARQDPSGNQQLQNGVELNKVSDKVVEPQRKVCTPISALLLPPMCPTGYLLTSMPTVLGVKCVCVPMPVPPNSSAVGSAVNSWSNGATSAGQLSAASIARSLDASEKK